MDSHRLGQLRVWVVVMLLELEQLLQQFLRHLQVGQLPVLGHWSYPLIALATVFEGPIVTLLGATTASLGLLNPFFLFLAIVAGNLTGDLFWFSLGRLGNPVWFSRYGRRMGITPQRLDQFQSTIRRQAPRVILVTKLTSSLIIPALIATGLGRVSWRRWLPALAAAELIKSGLLLLIGYFFGSLVLQFEDALTLLPFAITLLILLYLVLPRLLRVLTLNVHFHASHPIRVANFSLHRLIAKLPSYESLSRKLDGRIGYDYNQLSASAIHRRL